MNSIIASDMPRFQKAIRVLCYLTIGTVIVVQIVVGFMNFRPIDSHTYLMLLVNTGRLQLDPGSLHGILTNHGQLPITYIQALIAQTLTLPGEYLGYLEWYHVLLKFVLLSVLFIWARYIVDKAVNGELVLLCLLIGAFVSFPANANSFAYSMINFAYLRYPLGVSSQAIFFLAFTFWILGWRKATYISLFFLTIFHSVNAMLAAGIFIAFDLFQFFRKRITFTSLIYSSLWVGLSLFLVWPEIISLLKPASTNAAVYASYLFQLLVYTNSRHLFPWRISGQLTHFVSMSIATIALLKSPVLTSLNGLKKQKLEFSYFFAMFVCLLNIALLEGFHITNLGGDKILGRIFIIVDFEYSVLFAICVFESLKKKLYPLSVFLLLCYISFVAGNLNPTSVLLSSIWLGSATVVQRLSAIGLGERIKRVLWLQWLITILSHFSTRKIAWLWSLSGVFLVIFVGGGIGLGSLSALVSRLTKGMGIRASFGAFLALFSPWLLATLLIAIVFLVLIKFGYQQKAFAFFVLVSFILINFSMVRIAANYVNTSPSTSVLDISRWIVDNTEKTDLFLTPFTFSGYLTPAAIQRDIIIDNNIWDTFSYYPDILPGMLRAMKVIYGEDMLERSKNGESFQSQNFFYTLGQTYQNLDVESIRRIKREYPDLDYFVYPLVNSDQLDQARARFAPFQDVYRDNNYVIFKIEGNIK